MKTILIILFAILLCTSTFAFTPSEFTRSLNTAPVTNLIGTYSSVCARFTWNSAPALSDADFNNFVVVSSSNVAEFNGDYNGRTDSFIACTTKPGDWVKIIVYRIDGNADGYFLNYEPDTNTIVNPGTMTQAGIFTLYNILVAVAILIPIVVIGIAAAMLFKSTGFKFKF